MFGKWCSFSACSAKVSWTLTFWLFPHKTFSKPWLTCSCKCEKQYSVKAAAMAHFCGHLLKSDTNKCRLEFTGSLRSQQWSECFYINLYFYAWSHGIIVKVFFWLQEIFMRTHPLEFTRGHHTPGKSTLRTLQSTLTNIGLPKCDLYFIVLIH